jgi:hypothetical protein
MKQRNDSFYSLFVVRTKSRPCPHRFLVPQSRALTSFLGCPLTKDIVNILYTMIFTTTVIKKLSLLLPFFGSATESTETDLEPPGPGDTPVQHGSFAIDTSQIVLFKVSGTSNCANSLTKPLAVEQLASETTTYEVEVEP